MLNEMTASLWRAIDSGCHYHSINSSISFTPVRIRNQSYFQSFPLIVIPSLCLNYLFKEMKEKQSEDRLVGKVGWQVFGTNIEGLSSKGEDSAMRPNAACVTEQT